MNAFRKILFWSHLFCGVIAGSSILVMSVTGVLLTYEKQLSYWADTRHYRLAPPTEAQRWPLESLLAKLREVQSAAPVSITMRADRTAPVAFAYNGGRTVYVNPYNGEVLGEGAPHVRHFFHVVTDWHRWLGTEGAGRATGRAITGACNLAFLFIVISGLYLWFPRSLKWVQFKNILWFRRGLSAKARDFNWHNVIGFWSLVPLFLIVLSGVVISYPWASNLVYRLVGEAPPTPATRPASTPRNEAPAADYLTSNLPAAWAQAAQYAPGWNSLTLRMPTTAEAPFVFTIDHGTGGEPHKRATLTLDRQTGAVTKWEPFASFTKGRQLRSFLRFAHTGEVAGLAGQTIAGLVSFGGAVLVWTGLALAWRRFRAWKTQRAKVTAETLA